jgi:hypothetical protein
MFVGGDAEKIQNRPASRSQHTMSLAGIVLASSIEHIFAPRQLIRRTVIIRFESRREGYSSCK